MAERLADDFDAIRARAAELDRERYCARAQGGVIGQCWCHRGDGFYDPCPPGWDERWKEINAPASIPVDGFAFPPLSPVPWFPPRNAPKR